MNAVYVNRQQLRFLTLDAAYLHRYHLDHHFQVDPWRPEKSCQMLKFICYLK